MYNQTKNSNVRIDRAIRLSALSKLAFSGQNTINPLFKGKTKPKLTIRHSRSIINNKNAGWSSLVARWAHNPKVAGSNPAPATNFISNPFYFRKLQSYTTFAVHRMIFPPPS